MLKICAAWAGIQWQTSGPGPTMSTATTWFTQNDKTIRTRFLEFLQVFLLPRSESSEISPWANQICGSVLHTVIHKFYLQSCTCIIHVHHTHFSHVLKYTTLQFKIYSYRFFWPQLPCRFSSAGRASDWRSEGPVFDPRRWHIFFRLFTVFQRFFGAFWHFWGCCGFGIGITVLSGSPIAR